jgi:hypothetical protein
MFEDGEKRSWEKGKGSFLLRIIGLREESRQSNGRRSIFIEN